MDKSAICITLLTHMSHFLWINGWKGEGAMRNLLVRMDALLKLPIPERGWGWVGLMRRCVMRAPATESAKPLVSRPLRVRTSYVFAPLALRATGDSSSIKRQLRTAANDVYLVPMFRDFT